MHYNHKKYKRFMDSRSRKINQFIKNTMGWNHVARSIEVIDMSLRDLIYKIVPTKIVVQELKTSQGKLLNPASEYLLIEKKIFVTSGKKTQLDYEFSVDLVE